MVILRNSMRKNRFASLEKISPLIFNFKRHMFANKQQDVCCDIVFLCSWLNHPSKQHAII